MEAKLKLVRENLEIERNKLAALNEQGYLGRDLFDIMLRIIELLNEEDKLIDSKIH